jgi:hypothetical protein
MSNVVDVDGVLERRIHQDRVADGFARMVKEVRQHDRMRKAGGPQAGDELRIVVDGIDVAPGLTAGGREGQQAREAGEEGASARGGLEEAPTTGDRSEVDHPLRKRRRRREQVWVVGDVDRDSTAKSRAHLGDLRTEMQSFGRTRKAKAHGLVS